LVLRQHLKSQQLIVLRYDPRKQGLNNTKELIVNRMINFFSAAGFVLLSGLLTCSGYAQASTPDGETPANEGVCDILQGGTPGLYGLCVAYCEAQDLDTVDKNPPSQKILDNYNKKKQPGDPDMPCIQIPCPCWSDVELDAAVADGTISTCVTSGETIQLIDDSASLRFFRSDQTGRCSYVDFNSAPPLVRNLNVSTTDAENCHSQLSTACTATGH